MKRRLLAVIMSGMMICSLAGCKGTSGGSSENSSSDSSEETAEGAEDSSENTETSDEDLFAVMILPNVSEVVYSGWAQDAEAAFEKAGVKFEYAACDDDVNTMNQQIENYIVMGATHMMCQQISADAQAEALKDAVEAGIEVTIINMCDDDESYTWRGSVDQADMGDRIAKMAAEWIDETFPDAEDESIEVAIFGTLAFDHVTPRTEALANITDYTSKAVIVENYDYGASTQPNKDAQDWIGNVLLKYPDVKCVIGEAGAVLEMSEIVMEDDNIDKAKFGMFTDTESDAMYQAIAESINNESVVRGLCTFESIGEFFCKSVVDIDSLSQDGKSLGIDLFDVTADNVEDYL